MMFDVWCQKMIQISTFPAAPSTERVPSLAERVASLRYSINLQFLNNRVPALIIIHNRNRFVSRQRWIWVSYLISNDAGDLGGGDHLPGDVRPLLRRHGIQLHLWVVGHEAAGNVVGDRHQYFDTNSVWIGLRVRWLMLTVKIWTRFRTRGNLPELLLATLTTSVQK